MLTLGATAVVGVPIQPRDFLDDFGSGGELFGDLGNSIDDGSDFTSSIGGGFIDSSFNVADSSFVGGDLGLTGIESLDLIPVDTTAVTPETLYVDPQPPQIVADVQPTVPGLGAADGDLIATGPTTPDTNQVTPNSGVTISFANNDPIPEFTPTDSGVIASLENLNPADIGSSSNPDPGTAVAVNPDPGAFSLIPGYTLPEFQPSEGGFMQLEALQNGFGESSLIGITGTPPVGDGGLTIAGFVAPPDLGADTALTPNVDLINTPIAFSPDDTNVVATLPDITVPPVQIASTEGGVGTGEQLPSLQQFKDQANQLANDPNLKPEERQTWKDVEQVAGQLTPEDFGKITLNSDFTTPSKSGDGSTGDKVGDLTPKGQTAIRTANYGNPYRTNNGFNLGGIANLAAQGFITGAVRLFSVLGEKAILNPNNQIYTLVQKIGVPVSVAVPVTLKVGVAVPVTVATTLPGGVVTKILVYRPNVAKTTVVSTKPKSVVATATPKPKHNARMAKRDTEESSHPDPPTAAPANSEHDVLVPADNSDPEYYVEPEPKEWETAYGKEVVFNPVEVSGHAKEADKPKWDKIDTSFKYQPGDYSALEGGDKYTEPPSGKSVESSEAKDEPWHTKGSGGSSVEEVKPNPWARQEAEEWWDLVSWPAELIRVYICITLCFTSGQCPFRFILLPWFVYIYLIVFSSDSPRSGIQSFFVFPSCSCS